MSDEKFHTYAQESAYRSPWSTGYRIKLLLWQICWAAFCAWTPKPLNAWRLIWLRLFGAKLADTAFVHQRARIQIPWNLTMEDRACLGDRANAYTLGPVIMRARSTAAQESYLCTGTHDFSKHVLPLQTATIEVGEDAFVGARAFIMPGVSIGARAIVGSCAVVTRDVQPDAIVAGNPAKVIGQRPQMV